MPIDFSYHPAKKALFGSMKSPITFEEYRSTIQAIVRSKEFPSNIRTLWDLRELNFDEIDRNFEQALINISEQYPERGPAKVAFIVNDELGYGMTRMYEMLAENLNYETKVFRSYSEGEKWLLQEMPKANDS